jgi:hypothetical protein
MREAYSDDAFDVPNIFSGLIERHGAAELMRTIVDAASPLPDWMTRIAVVAGEPVASLGTGAHDWLLGRR